MKLTYIVSSTVLLLTLAVTGATVFLKTSGMRWSPTERRVLMTLYLGNLPKPPADPSNRYADNPHAATFGERLFFDTRLSRNGEVACATCHQVARNFTDGLPRSRGIGQTARKSMSVVGAAYSPFLFWDGRKDSLWAQALGPLEDPNEHGLNRTRLAHLVARHYRSEYERIFGPLPEMRELPQQAGPVMDKRTLAAWHEMELEDKRAVTSVFVNVGKAIAAYERGLSPAPSRFDHYLEALEQKNWEVMRSALSASEIAGLELFIGKANCTNCHSGPLLSNQDFHNTGVLSLAGLKDCGRATGAPRVRADTFNCLGRYSDAEPRACAELRFLTVKSPTLERAFKVPSSRNVARAAPYYARRAVLDARAGAGSLQSRPCCACWTKVNSSLSVLAKLKSGSSTTFNSRRWLSRSRMSLLKVTASG